MAPPNVTGPSEGPRLYPQLFFGVAALIHSVFQTDPGSSAHSVPCVFSHAPRRDRRRLPPALVSSSTSIFKARHRNAPVPAADARGAIYPGKHTRQTRIEPHRPLRRMRQTACVRERRALDHAPQGYPSNRPPRATNRALRVSLFERYDCAGPSYGGIHFWGRCAPPLQPDSKIRFFFATVPVPLDRRQTSLPLRNVILAVSENTCGKARTY